MITKPITTKDSEEIYRAIINSHRELSKSYDYREVFSSLLLFVANHGSNVMALDQERLLHFVKQACAAAAMGAGNLKKFNAQ